MSKLSDRARVTHLARVLVGGLEKLRARTSDGTNRAAIAFEIIEGYERLSGEVYGLRAKKVSGEGLREANEILSETAGDLLTLAKPIRKNESAYLEFIILYRQLWLKHFDLFLFTTSIFVAFCILGWNIGVHEPDYVALIAGQTMMETIYDHKPWFESIQGNSATEGARIALNNIKVCVTGFTLGAVLGLGGLVILGFNGLLFGCIAGYCYKNGFHLPLFGFVVSHGPLELTIIVASCFAGLMIGRAFYVRPIALMRPRLIVATKEAVTVCVGVIPWLILAAFFEGFISPYKFLPVYFKLALGLLIACLFWLWTFSPVPQAKREARRRL